MRNGNEGIIPKLLKIGPKIVGCMFIGYATNSKPCQVTAHMSEPSDS